MTLGFAATLGFVIGVFFGVVLFFLICAWVVDDE